jgi:hypothetical protein
MASKPIKPPPREKDPVIERYVSQRKFSQGVMRNVLEIARQEARAADVSAPGGRRIEWSIEGRKIAEMNGPAGTNKVTLTFYADALDDERGVLDGKKGRWKTVLCVGGWPVPKDVTKRRENANHDHIREWMRVSSSSR